MTKLNQIVAVVNGKKTEAKTALTELHRKSSNVDVLNGLTRTYQPFDEDGETFPDEGKLPQLTASKVFEELKDIMVPFLDVDYTQDRANQSAISDIVVDGTVIAKDVPVTYLMFVEKQLIDLEKFFSSIPTLDPTVRWNKDENQGLFVSEPSKTNKTKKVLQHKILYEATKEHPAQIEKWTEDVSVGTWTTTKFSGSLTQVEKRQVLDKVKKLRDAVKFAREQANSLEITQENIGEQLFNFLLTK